MEFIMNKTKRVALKKHKKKKNRLKKMRMGFDYSVITRDINNSSYSNKEKEKKWSTYVDFTF